MTSHEQSQTQVKQYETVAFIHQTLLITFLLMPAPKLEHKLTQSLLEEEEEKEGGGGGGGTEIMIKAK